MSHAPERKEKDCLNCGTIVHGPYCHVCGQQNVVPKESFGKLVVHFFNDITHFDGKFFDTAKYLFFKPGFLSREYALGRRAKYLNPIRMYIFTSAMFFLIFFALFKPGNVIKLNTDIPYDRNERASEISKLKKDLVKPGTDSVSINNQIKLLEDTTRSVTLNDLLAVDESFEFFFLFYRINNKSVREYDSLQALLPPGERDGWFKRKIVRRGIPVRNDLRTNQRSTFQQWGAAFLHQLPYLLFVSLPIFALILKLFYVRRKEFYYADHIIFTIHHYIVCFWLLLLFFGLRQLQDATGWGLLNFFITILILLLPAYLLLAMKRFYGQRWMKTILKFLAVNLLGFFMLLLLFVIFFVFILL